MTEKFDKYILKNGMVILGEPMEAVESVAFGFMLPAGAAVIPMVVAGPEVLLLNGFSEAPAREKAPGTSLPNPARLLLTLAWRIASDQARGPQPLGLQARCKRITQ